MTDDQVFIIRCWNEMPGEPPEGSIWRFRVSHEASEEVRHFADSKAVAGFIDACLTQAALSTERKKPI